MEGISFILNGVISVVLVLVVMDYQLLNALIPLLLVPAANETFMMLQSPAVSHKFIIIVTIITTTITTTTTIIIIIIINVITVIILITTTTIITKLIKYYYYYYYYE